MVALNPPVCSFGWLARPFSLLGTDQKIHTLESCRGPNGMLLMFICNHCPYVKAVLDRIIRDTRALTLLGIHSVAIMSNDVAEYPEDSFDNMQRIAREGQFPFPYLYDEEQSVAKAYGAVCTPDFFGFNQNLQLQYRGRLDASGMKPAPEGSKRELFEAMSLIAKTGDGPREQRASIGCSIKWKTA